MNMVEILQKNKVIFFEKTSNFYFCLDQRGKTIGAVEVTFGRRKVGCGNALEEGDDVDDGDHLGPDAVRCQ